MPNIAPHSYVRHQPELTLFYQVVEDHLPEFREHLRQHDKYLPRFVIQEFEDYLHCGRLEQGFIRVKCNGCRHEHLVAFSCKRRGFCPSCGARRMIETSARLVDHVIPDVPVRQWVLSFPWPLRLLFASRPDALGRCLAVIIRAIETHLIQQAGLNRASGARTGVVTLVQRFGSALNLNIHLHMMVLDGVYTLKNNRPCFHRVNAPDLQRLKTLLNRIISRVTRRLVKDGLLIPDSEQPWLDLEETDVLDTLNAASTRYRVAIGSDAGRRTLTLQNPALIRTDTQSKPFTVDRDGFSLNAAVSCQPHQRKQLERLCRYVTRPALCLERLSTDSDGKIIYELKHPFRDGTTHILFTPSDFLARLAALVPRPRANLTRYHGVFAPNSPFRQFIVPGSPKRARRKCKTSTDSKPYESNPDSEQSNGDPEPLTAPLSWAQRLKRVFEIDILLCPRCGGTLRVIADVTDPDVIRTILEHLKQRAPPQRASPARSQDDLFAAS